MASEADLLAMIGECGFDEAGFELRKPLLEQGLDSLDVATLLTKVERRWGREISAEQGARLRSLADFLSWLNESRPVDAD
jgi:acyl carrier protein